MVTTETSAIPPSSQQERLEAARALRTGLRSDLQITRQLTRNEPVYVVYDPVNFKAHRLSLEDYAVVSCLSENATLQECFNRATSAGHLADDAELEFYGFISQLDSLGLLSTSSSSSSELQRRFNEHDTAANKNRWASFLFLTLPLANPDKFLARSMGLFGGLFSVQAFTIWCAALLVSSAVLFSKWQQFIAPMNGVLAINNLLFMGIAFVGLKIWHELGHGYACKNFGGRVPEMGCKMIAGFPLAYVDATSAWNFPSRMHRIIVMLGGMYFESLIAIVAIWVWAIWPDTLIGAFAYQLIFMAGVAAIFFNANPLMRYDGYFILSDLVGIPNLRQRSTAALHRFLKKLTLGIDVGRPTTDNRGLLLTYGAASSVYGTFLMLSIALLLAQRMGTLGIILGALQIANMSQRVVRKILLYLLRSKETLQVRPRAQIVAVAFIAAIPLSLCLIPVPWQLHVPGIVSADQTDIIRANTSGALTDFRSQTGTLVRQGQILVELRQADTQLSSTTAIMAADTAQRTANKAWHEDRALGTKLHHKAQHDLAVANLASQDTKHLQVRAPRAGRLVYITRPQKQGVIVQAGEPLAKVVSGATQVRAWIDQSQLAQAQIKVGDKVRVRIADNFETKRYGKIISVAPAAQNQVDDIAVTTQGGGNIAVDPTTSKPTANQFQLTIAVPNLEVSASLQDARAYVSIDRRHESLGRWLVRYVRRFVNSILAS